MTYTDRRKHPRLETNQKADCANSDGSLPEVWLVDLTISGCQVIIEKGHVAVGQHVTIRPTGFEGLPAIVRWVEDDRAGIEFASDLYPAIFNHLTEAKLSLQQFETVSSMKFTDRFGRILPELRPFTLYRSMAGASAETN